MEMPFWWKFRHWQYSKLSHCFEIHSFDSKVHGANMGTTWVLSAPGGPHVGPTNLAIWVKLWYNPIIVIVPLRQPWIMWSNQSMMTSSNGNISALLALCAGNSPVPAQRPVTRSFKVFFDLRLNKRLGKRSWGWPWWFETQSCPLWLHCNALELLL